MEMSAEVARAVGDWVLARGSHDGPLFHRAAGDGARKPLNVGSLNRIVDAIGRASGMAGKLRPHGCRHAAVTELDRRGKTIKEIMDFTGHKNPQTVMRYLDSAGSKQGEMVREVSKNLE